MEDNRYKPIINNHVFYDEDMVETSEDSIYTELLTYKNKGFGGFAVNGRSRKPVQDIHKWLPGYFRTIRKYCDVAKELDMEMWIFDEWGFPSGTACGLVLTPENRMKKLNKAIDITLEKGEEIELSLPDRTIVAAILPVNRYAVYNSTGEVEKLSLENKTISYKAKRRSRLIIITWENCSFHTNEMRDIKNMDEEDTSIGSVDILDADCVRKFIDNMHERYKAVIGDDFGKTVRGFFYDEPEVCWDFPYSHQLPEYFRNLFGYELTDILPEIIVYTMQKGINLADRDYPKRLKKAFSDYTEAWNSMLAENFYGQIERWCHENNLLSIGHQDMDNYTQTLNTVSGNFFKNSKRNDMPGIDVIHDQIIPEKFSDYPRYAGSIKRLYNKDGAVSETFAVMGPYMPTDVMRYDMEHQIIRGIDKFFLYQNGSDPNAGDYTKELLTRVAETTRIMNEGKPGTRIGVLVPLNEITYDGMCLNPHHINGSPMSWERVEEVARILCYAPIDFDYVWEDGLENIRQKGFDTIIIPGVDVSEKAIENIKKFCDQGGCVLSVYRPCEQIPEAKFVYYVYSLIEELETDIRVHSNIKKISVATRIVGNRKIYCFLNESEREISARIEFSQKDVFYYEMYRKKWIRWKESGNFAPRELKIFSTGITDAIDEKVTSVIPLTEWSFNGNKLDKLISWTELGLLNYTGCGKYETEFYWNGGLAKIALGDVRYKAEVIIDGKTYKMCLSPWIIYTELPKGYHKMIVIIENTGASKDYGIPDKWHRPYEQPYLKCGLLGRPVIEHIEDIILKEKI